MNDHHIIPRELGGVDDKYNRVMLCVRCHSKIWIPNIKFGVHAVKGHNPFIINNWVMSSSGRLLECENESGSIFYL